MKKVLIILLSVFMIIGITPVSAKESETNKFPVFDSVDELEELDKWPDEFIVLNSENGMNRSVGASSRYIYEGEKSEYRSSWGYHPSFNSWIYCDGYYFSATSTVSMSVSVTIYGVLSIGVSAASSGSGYFINADRTRLSRPFIYGKVYYDLYRVEIYYDMGTLVSTAYQKRFLKNKSTLYIGIAYNS